MTQFVLGIDFGSTTGKAVILDSNGNMVAAEVSQKGAVSDESVRVALGAALRHAGLQLDQIARTVSTGYGRRMVEMADRTVTEISCHARGAAHLIPGVKLVIDIGGQDSKVIALDDDGLVVRFAMNDRCAGGTGKYFETLARALNVGIDEMGPMALKATLDMQVTSMCATFAETEVIALLAEGATKIEVLGGVHAAMAKRTLGLISRVGKRDPVAMTGGVARNPAAVHHIEKALETRLILPEQPQIAGALGAALFALDDLRDQAVATPLPKAIPMDDNDLHGVEEIEGSSAPACKSKAN